MLPSETRLSIARIFWYFSAFLLKRLPSRPAVMVMVLGVAVLKKRKIARPNARLNSRITAMDVALLRMNSSLSVTADL
jgi:hypothetical protein